jgi:cytosine/adenosine deaminase-related metal-dependent hydrolase
MPQFRTAWLLPISQPPIRDAWLRTERGRIVAFGHSRPGDLTSADEIDLGQVAVLPGLVNAHTHLELSWMRERIHECDDFPAWIRAVVSLMRQGVEGDIDADEINRAIVAGIAEARGFGTAVIGDISNTLATPACLIALEMSGVVFHELIAFQSGAATKTIADALCRIDQLPHSDLLRYSLAPHAPYSVSPALFGAIRTALERDPFARASVHLGESAAEIEFLQKGTGPWRDFLEDVGAWDPSWVAPQCGPVEFLERMGFVDDRLLVVHGVQLAPADLKRLATKGATMVTCPRGNLRTGAGIPPIADFYESGGRVAIGTDSLASVPDLSIFAELVELRRLAPHVRASTLLESATFNGARALGFDADFGTIEAGKRDAVIAIELAGTVSNIEEYLVSGIHASQIHWVSAL